MSFSPPPPVLLLQRKCTSISDMLIILLCVLCERNNDAKLEYMAYMYKNAINFDSKHDEIMCLGIFHVLLHMAREFQKNYIIAYPSSHLRQAWSRCIGLEGQRTREIVKTIYELIERRYVILTFFILEKIEKKIC